MINQKNVQMLDYLCGMALEKQSVRVDELAKKFGVSNRTIRYDLERIDDYLQEIGYHPLRHVKGMGVILDCSAEDIAKVRQTLNQVHARDYALSKVERKLYLRLLLLDAEQPLKYEQLADELYVSRKTVIEDMRTIKEEDAALGVHIHSSRQGIAYDADEYHLRQVILRSLLDRFDANELWQMIRGDYLNQSIAIEKKWRDIISLPRVQDIERLLHQTEVEQNETLHDQEFYLTMLLSAFALSRIRRGRSISSCAEEVCPPAWLQDFLLRMQENGTGELPQPEQGYIALELKSILNISNQEHAQILASVVAENLLVRVSEVLRYHYYADQMLRNGLQQHLYRLIQNKKVSTRQVSSIVSTVRQEHEALYGCIRSYIQQIPELHTVGHLEDECALLAVHFCASDERRMMMDRASVKVLVVCANGVGTAQIVSATVVKYFPQMEVLATTSVHNVQEKIRQEQPEMILSTISLPPLPVPVIRINPFMTGRDLDKIRSFIVQHKKEEYSDDKMQQLYRRILETIADTCEVQDRQALEHGVAEILGIAPPRNSALLHIVHEECILVGLEAENWEQAVRGSAAPLVEHGYVEPRYVQAMVDNIKRMGSYIVILPGIAMPHALQTDGVINPCLGVSILKTPIEFGNDANDPVRIVLCMSAMNNQEHMQEMSELIEVFSDEESVQNICNARSSRDILQIIRSYCDG